MRKSHWMQILLFAVFFIGNSPIAHSQLIGYRKEIDIPNDQFSTTTHIVTLDGGIAMLTQSYNVFTSDNYVTLLKLDAAGNFLWMKRFGPDFLQTGNLVQSPDSGYFFNCFQFSTYTQIMIKLDKAGNIVFSKTLAVPAQYSQTRPGLVHAKNDGGVYFAEHVIDVNTTNDGWHLVELDAAGNILLSEIYNMTFAKSYMLDLDTCSNGDILMLGAAIDVTGLHLTALTRIDPNGSVVWSKGYSVAAYDFYPFSCDVSANDMIYVGGRTYQPAVSIFQASLMKVDGAGNELWTFRYGSNSPLATRITNITENNSITMCGQWTLIKTDTTGALLCSREFQDAYIYSFDTLPGPIYTFNAIPYSTPHVSLFSSDTCGGTCMAGSLAVSKTAMSVTDTVLTGAIPVLLTDPAYILPTESGTAQVLEICQPLATNNPAAENEFRLFPNPAQGFLNVSSKQPVLHAEVYDASGRMIYSDAPVVQQFYIPTAAFAPGCYFLRITTAASSGVVKFVKE